MEYLLLSDGSVRVVPDTQIYPEVEDMLHAHPGSVHYWVNDKGWWRKTYISALGARKTEILKVSPPDMVLLAAMLE